MRSTALERHHNWRAIGNHSVILLASWGGWNTRGNYSFSWVCVSFQIHSPRNIGRQCSLAPWCWYLPSISSCKPPFLLVLHIPSDFATVKSEGLYLRLLVPDFTSSVSLLQDSTSQANSCISNLVSTSGRILDPTPYTSLNLISSFYRWGNWASER